MKKYEKIKVLSINMIKCADNRGIIYTVRTHTFEDFVWVLSLLRLMTDKCNVAIISPIQKYISSQFIEVRS